MSIELRFITRNTGKEWPDTNFVKILQYRNWIRAVTTGGVSGLETGYWSDWQDVPLVEET